MLDKTNPEWPPDYVTVCQNRFQRLKILKSSADAIVGAQGYYSQRPIEFIEHWCDTIDPRNAGTDKPTRLPFILFPRQKELVAFLRACLAAESSGLVEKSRDMGATWICCAFSVWLWLFWPGASVGWGSRKEQLVDHIGDLDSIFEKIRVLINYLPEELLPEGFARKEHMSYMRVVNPQSGATITGESGDNIGRGGRKLIYFKDESAHYEHPESIEAALTDNTRIQIDISSVNGLGNVFHRRREAGIEWYPGSPAIPNKTNVFVFDWCDHPEKTESWHEARKQKAEDDGLLHIFYQEVERNYSASVEGIIIPAEWVKSAIDAHVKIPGMEEGSWSAALDVADGGGDRNALAKRKGVLLNYVQQWGERDTGVTARRAVDACSMHKGIEVQYDCIGVGSGVKAETNRLVDELLMPKDMRFVPWNAGAEVLYPEGRVVEDDKDSPINKDFYANLKAQAWWDLRRRFEKTHRMLTEAKTSYPPDELISIDSKLPLLRELQKELSQPTMGRSARMKLLVEKMPEGTRSPNLADAVVMCYFPATVFHYDASLSWVGKMR
jgi:phage terminase large subunit